MTGDDLDLYPAAAIGLPERTDLARVDEGDLAVQLLAQASHRAVQAAELKSEGEVGSDDEHRAESELQKLTDSHVGDIDNALAGKEQEILEV